MKPRIKYLAFILLQLILISCSREDISKDGGPLSLEHGPQENVRSIENKTIDEFEAEFAKAMLKSSKDKEHAIPIMGYKTIEIKQDQDSLIGFLMEHSDLDLSNQFIAKDGSFVRIYMPLSEAILQLENKVILVNPTGIVSETDLGVQTSSLELFGRLKSQEVRGAIRNFVQGNTIFLSKKITDEIKPNHNYKVFELGELFYYDDFKKEANLQNFKTAGNPDCYLNHGGKGTCSEALEIHRGHCQAFPNVCMDYNGPKSDCKKYPKNHWKRYRNFIGSDCYHAMLKGYCWNELM